MIQKKLSRISIIALVILGLSFSNHLSAESAVQTDLIISQIKVTASSQFISLYNNTNARLNMAAYALTYFNNNQLSEVTSSKNIQLSGLLPAHSYYIINDGPIDICYQARLQSEALSFSSKAGMVEVVKLNQSPAGINFVSQDYVAWSSQKASSSQLMPANPAFLQRQQASGRPLSGGKWQPVKPSENNACQFVTSDKLNQPASSSARLLPSSPPPATIVSVDDSGLRTANPNDGLKAPQITELLPNPAKPQTDAKDEFIEIYNPNSQSFDLKGFKLQTASSPNATKHSFTFPGGTKIPGQSYAAYPSANISISLTNSGGMVWLLDPTDKVISQTQSYSDAKEGQAWAQANGHWFWTSTPTPNTTNIIKAAEQSKKVSGTGTGTVKGIATGQAADTTNKANQTASKSKSSNPTILVAVAVLAVVYGLYEYRRDLANWFHERQRNGTAGRKNRKKPQRPRGY